MTDRTTVEDRVTLDQILRRTFALLGNSWIEASCAVAGLAVLRILLDAVTADLIDYWFSSLFMWIASIVAQCELTRWLLLGLGSGTVRRRYGPMFAIAIATGIPLAIGFILVVLPGLYLLARWSISDVVLLAEDKGGFDSIATSWERTRPNVLPISLALVLVFVPPFILGATLQWMSQAADFDWGSGLSHVTTQIALVLTWYIAVAIHRELRPQTRELEHIFA